MRIELGQHIRSSDGHDIGKIKHLILAPANGQLKTLVVEKGFFLPEDVEIPLEAVEATDSEGLRARYTAEEIRSLPHFDESQYSLLPPEQAYSFLGYPYPGTLWPLGYPLAPLSMDGYPLTMPRGQSAFAPPSEREGYQRRHTEETLLSEGDEVFSKDGEKIGEVHRVTFDSATARPTSLVVRKGWLFPEDKEISASLIASITEGAVTLKRDKADLKEQRDEERYTVDWSADNTVVRK